MSTTVWLVAVPSAIGAAAAFGGVVLLQHHAPHHVPQSSPLRPVAAAEPAPG